MKKDNVVKINKPETFIEDPLTEILRQGARSLLAQALEVEIETVLNQYEDLKDQRVISVLCAMDICPSGKYKPVLDLYRWKPPGSEIGRRINQRSDILQFSHIATLSAED
jgi:hypothetical protein